MQNSFLTFLSRDRQEEDRDCNKKTKASSLGRDGAHGAKNATHDPTIDDWVLVPDRPGNLIKKHPNKQASLLLLYRFLVKQYPDSSK